MEILLQKNILCMKLTNKEMYMKMVQIFHTMQMVDIRDLVLWELIIQLPLQIMDTYKMDLVVVVLVDLE